MTKLLDIFKNNYLLFCVLFLGFLFRIYQIDTKPLHGDELASIGCSIGIPYAGINNVGTSSWEKIGLNKNNFQSESFFKNNDIKHVYISTLEDNGSILYFIALHFWIKLFGTSSFAVRFLSLICSLLTILFCYLFVQQLTKSKPVAIISIFILSIHPLSIASAQFCRSHAMAGMFTMYSSLIFIKILTNKSSTYSKSDILLYSISCAFAMMSHYFTVYVYVGHVLIALFFLRDYTKWKQMCIAAFIGILIFIAWMFIGGFKGLENVNVVHNWFCSLSMQWKEGDNPYYMPSTPLHLLGGVLQVLFSLFCNNLTSYGYHLSSISFLLIIPVIMILYSFNNERIKIILYLCIIISSQLIWGVFISKKMGYLIFLQPIYAQYVVPYVSVLMAVAIYFIYKNKRNNLFLIINCVLFFVILFISVATLYNNTTTNKTVLEIMSNYDKNDVIIYNNWNDAFLINLSLRGNTYKQKLDSSIGDVIIIQSDNSSKKIPIDRY